MYNCELIRGDNWIEKLQLQLLNYNWNALLAAANSCKSYLISVILNRWWKVLIFLIHRTCYFWESQSEMHQILTLLACTPSGANWKSTVILFWIETKSETHERRQIGNRIKSTRHSVRFSIAYHFIFMERKYEKIRLIYKRTTANTLQIIMSNMFILSCGSII